MVCPVGGRAFSIIGSAPPFDIGHLTVRDRIRGAMR